MLFRSVSQSRYRERENDMREILFRGKRVDNGEWVYGGLITYNLLQKQRCLIISFYAELVNFKIEAKQMSEFVIPETVGQYTGLTDKNGTKIFEGDILGCVDRIVRVNWNKENGLWDSEFLSYTHKPLCSNGIKAVDWKFRAEVIGNIHERENDE